MAETERLASESFWLCAISNEHKKTLKTNNGLIMYSLIINHHNLYHEITKCKHKKVCDMFKKKSNFVACFL